jgi:Uma2 family endonuclease
MTVAPAEPRRRYSLAEYLDFEDAAEGKHEFHDGEILAMSGGSPEHALIIANASGTIGNRLKGKPCRLYSSHLRMSGPPRSSVYHPDLTIICGPVEYDPDPNRQLVTNPRAIVEVLSPTTEAYDRGEKFRHHSMIASLAEYVLIAETAPVIENFVRQPDGKWLFAGTYSGLDAVATLRSVQIELKLTDVYTGVTFPEPAPPPDPRERETL